MMPSPTRSLAWKLTLAFLSVALTVALLVAVVLRLTNPGQLDRLIVEQQRSEFHDTLVTYYENNGSWAGVWEYTQHQPGEPFPQTTYQPAANHEEDDDDPPFERRPDPRWDRRELFGLVNAEGRVIIPLMPNYPPGATVSAEVIDEGEPVEVNGQVVGTILTSERLPGLTAAETAYLRRANLALLLAGGGAVLVALLVGILLARTLTRPLQALTQATHRMAEGELEQAVKVGSADEIGALAEAFNQMSRELARANKSRRQMTADIAHELRTPLTVIAGYIESMRDGVLAPTPERLGVIYAEIEHLQRLVGDLRTLSQADAGELKLNRQPVLPLELLQQTAASFAHQADQKGVQLELARNGPVPPINVDETRMIQVLGNLLSNALRYTPPGGRVELRAAGGADQGVTLSVRDTGPGIDPADLPYIFNRFYRADQSRAEESGESGLGLAIVKALVEAHGGTIAAESTVGEGTAFTIHLPSGAA
jgi:signal transduction histidine kinase